MLVVAPALIKSPLKHALGDVDEAREEAQRRLERSLEAIRRLEVDARGMVGDADPLLAIEDTLRLFDADEVIISTHPPERSAWLEKNVVERAREEIDLPITHVIVDLDADSESQKARTAARIPRRRRRRATDDDGDERLDYLPPLTTRDRLTLVVSVAGTIVLFVLALLCPDDGAYSGGCAVRLGIAGAAFMLTLWHGVALLLMGSVRYRGIWNALAADSVLFGVPAAIVVAAIVG